MREEKILVALRPSILTKDAKSPSEQFQNGTIRPLLKFQHTVIVLFMSSNVHIQHILTSNFSNLKKKNQIKLFIAKQVGFRSQLLGMISGLFTDAETQFYLSEKTSLDKRISGMILERFIDEIEKVH